MKGAISGWIFGALTNAGIQLPQTFDLKGVFFFVVQVLNVTYQYIRGKIVEKLGANGEALMSEAEKGVEIIQRLVTEGPSALWSMLQEGLSNLKEMVFDTIIEWARNSIIVKAVTKLLSLFNPAGAIIQAGMAIYNTVMYFIERWNQIQEFASSVIDSVDNVARGNITSASAYIEKMMGRGLTLLISFLARIAGLGRISDGIRSAVDRVRKPIHKAIDKGIGFIIGKVKGFASKIKGKFSKKTEEQVQNLSPEMQENWHKGIVEIGDISEKSKSKPFTRKSLEGLLSSIKSRFRFRSIEVTPNGKDWNVKALMNPEEHILVHGDESNSSFKPPSKRHFVKRVNRHSVAKKMNTIIFPWVDVKADVEAIQKGLAARKGGFFVINGRCYNLHNQTLFPVEGDGFHPLNRPAYKALGILNELGDTKAAQQVIDFEKISEKDANEARDIWRQYQ